MEKKSGRTALANAASAAFLRLIADSRWVTKRALELWLSSQRWRNAVIQTLQEDGLVTSINLNETVREKHRRAKQAGRESASDLPPRVYGGRRFALTAKGRKYLGGFNPERYGKNSDLARTKAEHDPRKIH